MSAAPPLQHLVVGPGGHGVVEYALHLARAEGADPSRVVRVERAVGAEDVPALLARLPAGERVHAHVTDRLFSAGAAAGRGPDTALAVLLAVAGRVRLSTTLHDLPQESDGEPSRTRRTRCYAQLARACVRVVVSSEHERALLAECLRREPPADGAGEPERVAVVPLAADVVAALARPRPADPAPTRPRDVAVLGYVYPGKGHAEVVDAVADLPADVGVLVLGRASDGHEDLLDELGARAERLGRRFAATGYLPAAELLARVADVAVPVAAHRHVSASGSIATWLAGGRRPLAPRNRYSVEVDRAQPGGLALYDDLPAALAAALADPASTWTPPGFRLTPSTAEVVAGYAAALGTGSGG